MVSTARGLDELLSCLTRIPEDWVLLHQRPPLVRNDVGDVDLAVTGSPTKFLSTLCALMPEDLRPILSLEHDVGEWTTVFATPDMADFVQVDVATGDCGRYGIRAEQFVRRAHQEAGLRLADNLDRSLYLLIKRLTKGQHREGARLMSELSQQFDAQAVSDTLDLALVPPMANAVRRHLAGDSWDAPRRPRTVWRQARRLISRSLTPAGGVAASRNADTDELTRRLRRASVRRVRIAPNALAVPFLFPVRAMGEIVVVRTGPQPGNVSGDLSEAVARVWRRRA